MFSQVQMIIAAVVVTIVISMGGTIWYLNSQLDSTKKDLLIEKVNTATLTENMQNMEEQIIIVTALLNTANGEMTEIRNEREESKQVLEDTSRLATLAKERSTLISTLAVRATKRVFDDFEDISTANPVDLSGSSTD